jgi:hypothetical protein
MALLRGKDSLRPCTRCLVPKDQQSDLTVLHQLRTPEHTIEILKKWNELDTKSAQEELLKEYGLRPHFVGQALYIGMSTS